MNQVYKVLKSRNVVVCGVALVVFVIFVILHQVSSMFVDSRMKSFDEKGRAIERFRVNLAEQRGLELLFQSVATQKQKGAELTREFVISKLAEYAKQNDLLRFDVAKVNSLTSVTGATEYRGVKIADGNVYVGGFEISLTFACATEKQVFMFLNSIHRDVGFLFVRNMSISKVKDLSMQILEEINSARKHEIIAVTLDLEWVSAFSKG